MADTYSLKLFLKKKKKKLLVQMNPKINKKVMATRIIFWHNTVVVTFFPYLLSCRLSQCSNFGGITPKKFCRTTLRGLLRIARKQFSSRYWLLFFFFFRHLITRYIQFIRLNISSSSCEGNTDDIRSNSPSVSGKRRIRLQTRNLRTNVFCALRSTSSIKALTSIYSQRESIQLICHWFS